jgi:hypothetical protein
MTQAQIHVHHINRHGRCGRVGDICQIGTLILFFGKIFGTFFNKHGLKGKKLEIM